MNTAQDTTGHDKVPKGLRDGLWLIMPPAVMFYLPTAIVQFVIHPGWSTWDLAPAFAEAPGALGGHLSHRLVYASMAFFHMALCLSVILFFWRQLRDQHQSLRRRAYRFMAVEAFLFLAVWVWLVWPFTEVTLFKLSYQNIYDLLAQTSAGSDLTVGTISKLSLLANLPQVFGIFSIVLAVGVVGSLARGIPQNSESEWRAHFAARVRSLQKCFLGLCAVLVTSTLTASLFFSFPAELAAEPDTRATLNLYAHGLTFFWGTVYTLTILVTVAPAALALRNQLFRHQEAMASQAEFGEWRAENVVISPRQLLGNLAALLGPLLVGVLSSLLKDLPGLT